MVSNEIKVYLNENMEKVIASFKKNLLKIRTGKATPSLLDGIIVNYYGTPTPLLQVGQISAPEARILQVQAFDKSALGEIEKAIINANLGVTPTNDGRVIRIPFPSLTEEKRKIIVKDMKKMGEEAKVNLRNVRRDCNEKIKKIEKDKKVSEDESKKLQEEVQEATDDFIKKLDKIVVDKEKDIMTI